MCPLSKISTGQGAPHLKSTVCFATVCRPSMINDSLLCPSSERVPCVRFGHVGQLQQGLGLAECFSVLTAHVVSYDGPHGRDQERFTLAIRQYQKVSCFRR